MRESTIRVYKAIEAQRVERLNNLKRSLSKGKITKEEFDLKILSVCQKKNK